MEVFALHHRCRKEQHANLEGANIRAEQTVHIRTQEECIAAFLRLSVYLPRSMLLIG